MRRRPPFNMRYPISASVQVGDLSGSGSVHFLAAGRSLWKIPVEAGGRPARLLSGKRPIASTACVADFGKGPGVVVGCDDGSIYATWARDQKLVTTGLDVYSSPVAFTSKAHGNLLAFGSDDGGVWCTTLDGAPLPGFPVKCAAFVSATPAAVDFDGDGEVELLVGDWAGRFHALRLDGSELPGFPVDLGWPVWSSACAADLDGDGALEVVVATRYLHALRAAGTRAKGFPRLLGSYAVSSPIVVDLMGDGRAAAVVGSDKLYAFDGSGHALPGFPADLGAFLWASPVVAESPGRAALSLFVGAWDRRFYEVVPGETPRALIEARGPFFASAGIAARSGGGVWIAAGSWDGRLYFLERDDLRIGARSWATFHGSSSNERVRFAPFERPPHEPASPDTPPSGAPGPIAGSALSPAPARHRRPTFVAFDGPHPQALAHAQIVYTVGGEGRAHPSPAVVSGGALTSLVQPLGVGRVVRFHLEGTTFAGAPVRFPLEGEQEYVVSRLGPLPIGRLVARLEGRT